MALYKKPQGSKAVIMPKVADCEKGEYLFMKFINRNAIPVVLLLLDLKMKTICIKQTITITIANFFAEKSKKFLKIKAPIEPASRPIIV